MHPDITSNPIIDRLPAKLKQYIKPQDYERYTAQDHALWRYVMRKNIKHLQHVAHESYLEGLDKTGITIERIPSMYGMNRILQDIGWAAVAVDGLIPSDAFMEFQAYNTLVIASDIRQLDHIEYTPTPDIIHESAGHAPILANREYAEYLRRFGQIGSKAISSALDDELYEAVRTLSILKEHPSSSRSSIIEAEEKVTALQGQITTLSEMTQMRNLHWWTVEYGLIGTIQDYKQYGAGLLSSIGESKWCMTDEVTKIPYTIEAAQQNFDVTKPQPQLFVTPDFAHLNLVLEEFAESLSLRKGGLSGLKKLIASKGLGTIELSTGLQISGTFTKVIEDDNSRNGIAYFQTSGETVLAYRDQQMTGHGRLDHPNGIGSPLGYLKGYNLAIEDMSPKDLAAYDIHEGKRILLEFESGVKVEGRVITGARNIFGKIQAVYFEECLVTYQRELLFTPDMGVYCMAVCKDITSAYAGPADDESFDLIHHQVSDDSPITVSDQEAKALELFGRAKSYIKKDNITDDELSKLEKDYLSTEPTNWLLGLEIIEVAIKFNNYSTIIRLKDHLNLLANDNKEISHLINEGLEMIEGEALLATSLD